jgi:hypothetical protein
MVCCILCLLHDTRTFRAPTTGVRSSSGRIVTRILPLTVKSSIPTFSTMMLPSTCDSHGALSRRISKSVHHGC